MYRGNSRRAVGGRHLCTRGVHASQGFFSKFFLTERIGTLNVSYLIRLEKSQHVARCSVVGVFDFLNKTHWHTD